MSVNQADHITIEFNSFSERLDCSARLFTENNSVSIEPIGDILLRIPRSYLDDERHGRIMRRFNFVEHADPVQENDQDLEEAAEIDLETIKRRCQQEIENLELR